MHWKNKRCSGDKINISCISLSSDRATGPLDSGTWLLLRTGSCCMYGVLYVHTSLDDVRIHAVQCLRRQLIRTHSTVR